MIRADVPDRCHTPEAHQDTAAFPCMIAAGYRSATPAQSKVAAINQLFPVPVDVGLNRMARAALVIGALQCLLDMQGARLAGGIDALPVVEPVGDVAGLLHLE